VFSVELYQHLLKKRMRKRKWFIPTCAKVILSKKEGYIILFLRLEITQDRSERGSTNEKEQGKISYVVQVIDKRMNMLFVRLNLLC